MVGICVCFMAVFHRAKLADALGKTRALRSYDKVLSHDMSNS